MMKEFLEGLELSQETAEAILQRHENAVQQLRFDHRLASAITQVKGRNHKAIMALLDLPALQENPDELEAALAALKQENDYLFEPDKPAVYAKGTGTQPAPKNAPTTLAGALKERFERKK